MSVRVTNAVALVGEAEDVRAILNEYKTGDVFPDQLKVFKDSEELKYHLERFEFLLEKGEWQFNSKGSTVHILLVKMSESHPNVRFVYRFFSEGFETCGSAVIQDGKIEDELHFEAEYKYANELIQLFFKRSVERVESLTKKRI